jgi:hypothetical protein
MKPKVIKIYGVDDRQIESIGDLLNKFLEVSNPHDVQKLLTAAHKNPGIIKNALKFI